MNLPEEFRRGDYQRSDLLRYGGIVTDIGLDQSNLAAGVSGLPGSVRSREELLQQALIRLTVPRGNFSYDPELGSRLHTLVMSGAGLSTRACELVEETLAALPGASVEQAVCAPLGGRCMRFVAEFSASFDPGTISLELTGQEGQSDGELWLCFGADVTNLSGTGGSFRRQCI